MPKLDIGSQEISFQLKCSLQRFWKRKAFLKNSLNELFECVWPSFCGIGAKKVKPIRHTQTIHRQFADELFECVWSSFCGIGARSVKPIN